MANTNANIIYTNDIINIVLNNIINISMNTSSSAYASLPSFIKPNYSQVAYTHDVSYTIDQTGQRVSRIHNFVYRSSGNFTYYFSDVGTATTMITNDFNSFINNRGISTKQNMTLSKIGLFNLLNNVASYASGRLLIVGAPQISTDKYVMFDCTAVDTLNPSPVFPPVSPVDTEEEVTLNDMESFISGISTILVNSAKIKNPTYTYTLEKNY